MARISSIDAEIEVPTVVEVPQGAEEVTIDARVTLRNTGDDDVVVHAASGDDRHFWHVFDGNHREIMREKRTAPGRAKVVEEDGVHSFCTETVAAGHEAHASRQLTLAARKLRPGQVYTVRAEVYGHIAESSFTVVGLPAPVKLRPPKKKKTTARKPAKKPAARKAKKKAGR